MSLFTNPLANAFALITQLYFCIPLFVRSLFAYAFLFVIIIAIIRGLNQS